MKYLALLILGTLSLTSCRRCHQCELKESLNGYQLSKANSEFCGSRRQMRQHESENSGTRSATVNQVKVTYVKEMNCN